MYINQVYDEDGFWTPALEVYPGRESPYAEDVSVTFALGVEVESWSGPAKWKLARKNGKVVISGPGKFEGGVQTQDANTLPGPRWDYARNPAGEILPPFLTITLATRNPIPYQTGLAKSFWVTPEGTRKIVNNYIGVFSGASGNTPSPWANL